MGWRMPWQGSAEPAAPAAPLAPFDAESRERLEWLQPNGWKPNWELVQGGKRVARLGRGGPFDQNMTIEFADASWRLRHRWSGHIDIEALSGAAKPAQHRTGWFSGKLLREGQPELKSCSGGFWNMHWDLVTRDEEQVIVRVRSRGGFRRSEGDVELSDAARRLDDVELLVGVNWALALIAMRQAATAAAT